MSGDVFQRRGFRPGTRNLRIANRSVPHIQSLRDVGTDADMDNLRASVSFKQRVPMPRRVIAFEKLEALQTELEGPKVRLGQSVDMLVPDPNSPDPLHPIMIKKKMLLADVLKDASLSMQVLQRENKIQLGDVAVQLATIAAGNMANLNAAQRQSIVDILRDKFVKNEPHRLGIYSQLVTLPDITSIPTLERDLALYLVIAGSLDSQGGRFDTMNVARSRTNAPIQLNTVMNRIQNGEVLNLINRRLYSTYNQAENSLSAERLALQQRYVAHMNAGTDPKLIFFP